MKTIIRSNKSWLDFNWRELWEYRDLLILLVQRDLVSVYKQTILGPLWFIIQPLLTTVVFTIIFGTVAQIPTDGMPKFVFYMSGTVLWNYFQGCLNHGAQSLIGNTNLFTKVYFPRLVIPLSGIFVNLAHFLLNFVMFLGFYFYFLFFTTASIHPSIYLWCMPLLVLQCALIGLGFGLWVAGLTTKYRDLKFILPFLIQLWMYATPIVYPVSLVKTPLYRALLWLNPMSAPVELCRYVFTGAGTVTLLSQAASWLVTGAVLITGIILFNRVQRTFVDIV